jgi:ADP-ribosylation factor 1/2
MGQTLSSWFQSYFMKDKKVKILFVGLDGAGKTTILFKLKLGETIETVPTFGLNIEKIKFKKLEFTMWDYGGRDKIRTLLRHYYFNTDVVIFVVDSNDTSRISEASEELQKLMSDDLLGDVSLLVFANKQDLKYSLNVSELVHRLKLHELKQNKWHIQPCCAISGDGLFEGLDWLSNSI